LPEATVIAVGPGAPNKEGVVTPVSVNVGDRVLLPGWGGSPIKVGEDVSVMQYIGISVLISRSSTFSKTPISSPRSTNRHRVRA